MWPVFIEIRDAIRNALAPSLPLPQLLERGQAIARSLRQTPRRRKMQNSKLPCIFVCN